MKQNKPFHYDIVGSFLRPDILKEARQKYKNNSITLDELREIENQEITKLILKQKELGLPFITDGEFRRETWHLDFMWGFDGVEHKPTQQGIPFHGEPAMIDDTYLVGKISVHHHPFIEHFQFVKQFEDEYTTAKQTIPSPAQFLFQMISGGNLESTLEIYPNKQDLMNDIANGYKKVIQELYQAGCRCLQFDDCTWGVIVDPNACAILDTDEEGLQDIINDFITINNLAMEDKPDDFIINTHICRGNFHSTWACSGGYDRVAKDLFARENVHAFYLEYDDERSGSFEALKYVSDDKYVVLGLITTKNPQLENKDEIIARIHEASQYIPLERLSLSPQCGFASTEEGNKLSMQQQWDKIKLVKEIADEIWR